MKLRQLIGSWFDKSLSNPANIKKWLNQYGVKNFTINDDLTVDVDGYVDISGEKLGSIPIQFGIVSGHFWCGANKLTSLKGAPREVGGDFMCEVNFLSTLEGAPREVGRHFVCSYNHLTSLRGAPRDVGGSFSCDNNQLATLKGSPKFVGIDFYCMDNPKLKSLDGIGNVTGDIFSDLK